MTWGPVLAAPLLLPLLLLLLSPLPSCAQPATLGSSRGGTSGGGGSGGGGSSSNSDTATIRRDEEVLLAMKATFVNGEELLPSWVPGTDPCAWRGISCGGSGSHVETVSLTLLGLEGRIPNPGAWALPERLARLELGFNRISGTIPADFKFPPTLQTLFLSNNSLSGSLPPLALGDQFTGLVLRGCNLTGSLPAQWVLPPRLAIMDLASNALTGTIPNYVTTLDSLEVLTLSNNRLTGALPARMSFNTSVPIYGIAVFDNMLTGTLPTWPNAPNAQASVAPQMGPGGFCGQVPAVPRYVTEMSKSGVLTFDTLTSLPLCGGEGTAHAPGRALAATVASATLAAAGSAVVAALLGIWYRRRRKRGHYAVFGQQDEESALPTQHHAGLDRNADPLIAAILDRLAGPAVAPNSSRDAPTLSPTDDSGDGSSGSGQKSRVDTQAYLLSFTELKLLRLCGRGAFGRVYVAEWKNVKVAAKILLGEVALEPDINLASEAVLSRANPILLNLRKEANVLAALRHPNVVAFVGLCAQPPCLVSEFCERGSLYDVLRKARSSPELARQLDWALRLRFALDSAAGMLYLHSFKPPILHRDLKSPNLLISQDWRVKVCDFNQAKVVGESSFGAQSSASVGNPRWQAPEVLAGGSCTFASDVFAYGMVLYELLTWQLPWGDAAGIWQVCASIARGERPDIPAPMDLPGGSFKGLDGERGYIDLIQRCWAQDPQDRPSFPEIIVWLKELRAGLSGGSALATTTTGSSSYEGGSVAASVASDSLLASSVQISLHAQETVRRTVATAVNPVAASPFEALRG